LILIGGHPSAAAIPFLFASFVVHIGYNAFLLSSYRVADLSHAYPLARGSAPLLATLGGVMLAGDQVSLLSMVGITIVCGGIVLISMQFNVRELGWSGIGWPLATGLMISSYTVIDGMGVRTSGNALGYIGWLFLIDGVPFMLWCVLRERRVGVRRLVNVWKVGLLGGFMSMAAYGLVIFAMSFAAIGPVAALRETGVILAAVIGAFVLHEPFGGRRIMLAVIVVAGSALLYLGR
ncbi:MAG: EamA family transporter, partial [Rhodospirillaceae bacterium]|nr:EamA family transporter [Rhodospirillaceae bacterium]